MYHRKRRTMGTPRSPAGRWSTGAAVLAIGSLAGALTGVAPAQARAFGLDPSFGTAGTAGTDFTGFIDEGLALLMQNDKPVVAGSAGRLVDGVGVTDFGLTRYTADGDLDPGFGSGGKVTTDFFGSSDDAYAVAGQPDGSVVAAGRAFTDDTGDADFALARYRRDGTLDPAFGSGGKVSTDFGGTSDTAKAMVRQPDGKIVVAGNTQNYPVSDDIALARYRADGTLDTSFGSGGRVVTRFGGNSSAAALVLQADGKLVVAGETSADGIDFALARYHRDGTLDTGFGGDGMVVTDFGGADRASALLVDRLGRILAVGGSGSPLSSAVALARYRGDGSLDRTFGTDGLVTTEMDNAVGVAVVAQGTKLLVGAAGGAFTLARYHRDGTLDRGFGTDGVLATYFGSSSTQLAALALDRRGRVVAAGTTATDPYYWGDFFVARYR
ncbi:hypothetical protein Ait01nite_011500 [Actinoplanes italicus]|uniref:Putative delta-60 repeat protein n=2 Tax=Actinoplanes italicus TaxID=113567 RepID=A0A2T0KH78_9ACTN|nr:putative delta-60 repeat protein [Actinoplanes italicus]GIE28105.1 hypothetical protein Ait01nite_011500 [Actinoplanes italicus]